MDNPFFISVPRALSFLYREGKTGHWVDVRTTSEAILALLASGESIHSPHIDSGASFLISSFITQDDGGNWGSELWDTALAVRALHCVAPKGQDIVEHAFRWIYVKQLPDGSFDGEPWDSLFVCQAALDTGRTDRILKTIEWLVSLQTSQGVVISRHYSGLFCQVVGKALALDLPSALRHKFREAGTRALHFLWDEYDPVNLWGEGTWTNAYIIRGMVALKHPPLLSKFDETLGWYIKHQADNGAWDDTVRTAIVLQALLELGLSYELDKISGKSLQTLSAEFLQRSTEAELFKAIGSKTQKVAVIRTRKLLDRDENGNRIITLTKGREAILAAIITGLGLLWGLIRNWDFVRHLIFR